MASLTVENYLKAILQLSMQTGSESIATGRLAEKLNVSPGTVTSMLKTLSESGLATYKPYEGAALTDAGRTLAVRMVRRHRLIELFLVRTLRLTWDQVHDEAENLEHSVSDFLIDRIDEFLGRPETDPHGAPIPTADGELRGTDRESQPLSDCAAGTRFRFVRVVNQEPEFLRYLTESGFQLGAIGVVRENNPDAGIVLADVQEQILSVGHTAAGSIQVEMLRG